jgi:hypothetical protein
MDGVNLTSMQNMEWDQDGNWSMTTGSGPTVADDGRYEVSLPSLDFNVNINGYPATPATYTVPTAPAAKAFRTDHPAT